MEIQKDCFVAMDFSMALDSGDILERSEKGKPYTLIVGARQVPRGLEEALLGMTEGEKLSVVVEPQDGFGPYDKRLVKEIPRSTFPEGAELTPGMAFQADGPRGQAVPFRVISVDGEAVEVDFNHPLAGQTLHFEVKIVEVRQATKEELASAPGRYIFCTGDCHSKGCGGCKGH